MFDRPLRTLGTGERKIVGGFVRWLAHWVDNIGSMVMTIEPAGFFRHPPDVYFYDYNNPDQLIGRRRMISEQNLYHFLGQLAPFVTYVGITRNGVTTEFDVNQMRISPALRWWPGAVVPSGNNRLTIELFISI